MRRSFADTEAPLALAPQSTFEPVEIALWGLTYDVDGTRLLDGVTARFDHGQSAAVLGPSGAGKSTLLGVLGGHAGGNVGGALRLNGVAPSAAPARRRSPPETRERAALATLARPRLLRALDAAANFFARDHRRGLRSSAP